MLDRVDVLTWNVAHQIHKNPPIPETLALALLHSGAGVVIQTEFVNDRTGVHTFQSQLGEGGYVHQVVTSAPARHNHVFVASRIPFDHGDIKPPVMDSLADEFAQSNFLHIKLSDSPIELIGVRAPWWNPTTNRLYRRKLTEVLRPATDNRALAVTGDLNEDPFKEAADPSITSVMFPDAEMYSVARPKGDWSFTNHDGSRTSRIDHECESGAR